MGSNLGISVMDRNIVIVSICDVICKKKCQKTPIELQVLWREQFQSPGPTCPTAPTGLCNNLGLALIWTRNNNGHCSVVILCQQQGHLVQLELWNWSLWRTTLLGYATTWGLPSFELFEHLNTQDNTAIVLWWYHADCSDRDTWRRRNTGTVPFSS
jgi:hypothetical protein